MRKMKDSGIEWIGEIPEGWETKELRYIFQFNTGLTITRAELMEKGVPCVNYGEIHSKYGFDLDILRDELKCADFSFLDNKQSSIVKDNDFIFCDTSEDIEGSGNCVYISNSNNQNIFAGSHTIVARPIIDVSSRYLAYLFSTQSWRAQIRSVVCGIKVFSITQNILKSSSAIIPPIETQKLICDYLDKKCVEIDSVIKAKETTNEKLKEYRQSIIYETVTKGLDKNAPMKDSGIEWIGEIPQGWETAKIKYTGNYQSGNSITSTSINEDGDFPVYGGNGIRGYTNQSTHVGEFVLIGRQGALCGNVQYVNIEFWASEHAIVGSICSNFAVKFMYYSLFSMNLNQYSESAAQPGLSVDRIVNLRINYPKAYENQQQIADYLDKKCAEIDSVISANGKTIEKLKEYRQSVIYEAVTGKMEI